MAAAPTRTRSTWAGNTTSRPGLTGQQTLTWNLNGDLTTVTEAGQETTFGYDADGNRLIRRDPDGTVTAYLGSTELRKDPTGTVTATRYYGTTAVRTATSGLTWIIGDHHGTGQLAIHADDLSFTRRRLDPFGLDRAIPVAWPGEKGFVRGTQDPTGLTHLGAREYDPTVGRFTSVDPVFDTDDPQSMTGYSYCNADPVNCIDADGHWGWKKFFSKVAVVASVASMIPGPIGTAAGLVSAGAYLAAGNKTEALWALGGAAAALVGARAAVKGARIAVGAIKVARAASKAARAASRVTKVAAKVGKAVGRHAKAAGRAIKASAGRAAKRVSKAARAAKAGVKQGLSKAGRASVRTGKAVGHGARYAYRYVRHGWETKFGKNWRFAPFGNRKGGWYNLLPHYHHRKMGPGQGIGRHRPWQSSHHDIHWWDRF